MKQGDTVKNKRTQRKDFVHSIHVFNFPNEESAKCLSTVGEYGSFNTTPCYSITFFTHCRMVLTEKTLKIWK